MILEFPDLPTLELALRGGCLPADVVMGPVRTGRGQRGQVWLETASSVPRQAWDRLNPLGVRQRRASSVTLKGLAANWFEIIPLRPQSEVLVVPPSRALIRSDNSDALVRLIRELVTLGNTTLELAAATRHERISFLVRVQAPPLYSLLKAMEAPRDDLTVLVQHAPGCWIEAGWDHPLIHQLRIPETQLLLIDHRRGWQTYEIDGFRPLDDSVAFALSTPAEFLPAHPWPLPLNVPLRLISNDSDRAPQLWLMKGDVSGQLEKLVGELPEPVLDELNFAVCDSQRGRIGVLYAPRGLTWAPEYPVPGDAYTPTAQLDTLFVPTGTQLAPPLRGSTLRRLLEHSDDRLTWLTDISGQLHPQSILRDDLHPLADFVHYVLDQSRERLTAWKQAISFEFAPFVIESTASDEGVPQDRHPTATESGAPENSHSEPKIHAVRADQQKNSTASRPQSTASAADGAQSAGESGAWRDVDSRTLPETRGFEESRKGRAAASETVAADTVSVQLHERIRELQHAIVERDAAPNEEMSANESLQRLWKQLAQAHRAAGNLGDAAACSRELAWLAHLASTARQSTASLDPSVMDERDVQSWIACECGDQDCDWPDLLRQSRDLLDESRPVPFGQLSALVASLAAGVARSQQNLGHSEWIADALQFLEHHAPQLSLRIAWMAWRELAKAAGGDALMLARARDRVLQLLHDPGMDARTELPSFLRVSVQTGGQHAGLCEQLEHFRERTQQWETRHDAPRTAATDAYIDLLFAQAYARLGDSSRARELLEGAAAALPADDAIHAWSLECFRERIEGLETGTVSGEPSAREHASSARSAQRLQELERMDRYKVDRLRAQLVTLQPPGRIDPFRQWSSRLDNDLQQRLVDITAHPTRSSSRHELAELLENPKWTARQRMQIVSAALEVAPHGDRAAFDATIRQLGGLPWDTLPPLDSTRLLLHAVTISGHLNRPEVQQECLNRFQAVLSHAELEPDELPALSLCVEDALTALRRMTSRDALAELLSTWETLLQQAQQRSSQTVAPDSPEAAFRRLVWELPLTPTRLATGRRREAEQTAEQAVRLLENASLSNVQRLQLAVGALRSLAEFPVDERWERVQRLFTDGIRIDDRFATRTHFALARLRVVEAALLALVPEQLTFGPDTLRRLDAREFALRHQLAAGQQIDMTDTDSS